MEIVNLRYKFGKPIEGGGFKPPSSKFPWILFIILFILIILLFEQYPMR